MKGFLKAMSRLPFSEESRFVLSKSRNQGQLLWKFLSTGGIFPRENQKLFKKFKLSQKFTEKRLTNHNFFHQNS